MVNNHHKNDHFQQNEIKNAGNGFEGYGEVWHPTISDIQNQSFLLPHDTVYHYSMSYSYVFTIHKPLSKEFEKSSENEFAIFV